MIISSQTSAELTKCELAKYPVLAADTMIIGLFNGDKTLKIMQW